ncbi:MAG TPA: neutral zinc metallopeptidase, partial [Rhodanobacter sp.]|nr:neutral zinc metallopeptidase [Rhodanobacter sp.]
MDWRKGGSSDNIEMRSGGGGGGRGFGGGRMGLGGLIVLALIGWIFFKNPLALLDQGSAQLGDAATTTTTQVDPEQKAFVSAILASTEQTWGEIFQARGLTYVEPKLDLFSGSVGTACGGATTAVGPFYCPG